MAREHADGTECLEGTRSVPDGWTQCCETFGGHVESCAFDIRYEFWPAPYDGWVIVISESAGGGGTMIRWCPHCGTELGGWPEDWVDGREAFGPNGRRLPIMLDPDWTPNAD